MKKTAVTAFILLLSIYASLPAQDSGANEAYINAMKANNPEQRANLLKAYLVKYGGKGTQYENYVNAELCLINYAGKTAKETIEYGENALTLGGLDDLTKCKIYLTVSGIYSQLGQNLERAKDYSLQVIQISKKNKDNNDSASPAQWNKFIGAGYYTNGQALEKAKDLKGAADSYINSYNILKNNQIVKNLMKIGKSLYDFKFYREAEEALKIASSVLKDFGSYALYAKCLYRNGKKEEALKNFKIAYMKEKSGEIAYNIGIILAGKSKRDPSVSDEAIDFLLEASFLSPAHSKKAMELAENLFFVANKDLQYNEKVKELVDRGKKLEGLTNGFNNKFGEKAEEDLTDDEKKEMKTMLANIDAEKEAIAKLDAETKAALEKFKALIERTKKRLGIS
jgi:tetratricopeptide (TPR) repeat protein